MPAKNNENLFEGGDLSQELIDQMQIFGEEVTPKIK